MQRPKFFSAVRLMCFFAAIVLLIGTVMSYNHTPLRYTIIPKPEISIFIINLICTLMCTFMFFKPSNYYVHAAIMFIQAITTTLTGFETLGTFLYESGVVLCFCNGFFKKNLKQKIYAFILIWILVLTGYGYSEIINNPVRGKYMIVLECGISFFFFSFYYYTYKKLESLLTVLVPAKKIRMSRSNLPAPGSVISLKDYKLSERQIQFTLEYLRTEENYEVIAKKFYLSKSTVKREMAQVFPKFGVTNLNDLHMLLLQYIVKA